MTRWTVGRPLVAAVLAASAVATPAHAAFERRNLLVPGNVLWVTTGDINGDEWVDLVVSFRRGAGPEARLFLGVFVRRPVGLPVRPDLVLPAPSHAAAFDLGDVDGDGADELVYLMASGAFYQKVQGDRVQGNRSGPVTRLVSTPTLAVVPEEEDLVNWDFLRPLAPGQPSTLILPGRRRLRLFRRTKKKGWASWCDVRLRQWSYYDAENSHYRPSGRGGASGRPYAFRVTTIVPNIDFVEQTGDGVLDLVTHYEDRISVHPGGRDGCFSVEPTYRHWFEARTREEQESRDQRVSGRVADLDGDGIADFAVTKIGGGITTLKTELRLYRGLRGGGFAAAPAQVFKDDGFAALARFVDVDGDGRPEMVHPHAEVSIMGMTRAMLSSSLGLDVRIRRADKAAGFFAETPLQTLDVSIGLDLSSGAALRGAAPVFGYDFDGDQRPDAVLPAGAEEMIIHPGRPRPDEDGWFDEDRRTTLRAPGSNATVVLPTSAKGTPEILVYYPYRKDLSGRLVVFRRAK